MGGGMDMQRMMLEAQKMQQKLAEAQEGLGDVVVEGSAGGGMVKVKVSGDLEIQELVIDPEAVDPDDVEMLQDMVVAAVNEGLRAAQELADSRISAATGGLNIPGLM
ncbi:MAG: YbaB/EbfC family nucleoid-associated protein [Coriobacteriales bacterium]|nr:YbaB/EbfC family nucleoid-associated protein [Coriobacteriales bacterium]